MDLLTAYKHHSELQLITTLLLISTLYKSLHAKSSPACNVFTRRCLVTAFNNADSSASVLMSLLSGEYPATELQCNLFSASLAEINSELSGSPQLSSLQPLHTDRVENTVPNTNSIIPCVFVAAGTCLPNRCLETGCITQWFIRLPRSHCIATAVHFRI
jgi:hypothetical protein